MASISKSHKTSEYITTDNRVAADNGAIGISGGGNVTVHMVPDEAFDFADSVAQESLRQIGLNSADAIRSANDATEEVGRALVAAQEASREDTARILEKAVTIGLPVAAIAYVAAKVWK